MPAPEIVALSSARDFEQIVLTSPQPALVVFYSPSCMSCRSVMRQVPKLGREFMGEMAVFTMTRNTWGALEKKHGITKVPTVILFANGQQQKRLVGWMPLFMRKRAVRKALARASD